LETVHGFGNYPQFWKPPPVLGTGTGFGNYPHFPKLPPVLETAAGFGNSPWFWKPLPVLGTVTGFGNSPSSQNSPWFWKPLPVLGTGTGFGNCPQFSKLPPVLETAMTSGKRLNSYSDQMAQERSRHQPQLFFKRLVLGSSKRKSHPGGWL